MGTRSDKRTASEKRFEEYLEAVGHRWRRIDARGRAASKTPDYLVRLPDAPGPLCEVKEFTSTHLDRRLTAGGPGHVITTSGETISSPVRDAIHVAAGQLKPFEGRGRALIVVLANPHTIAVHLRVRDLIVAMYGDLTLRGTVDTATGEPIDGGEVVLGRNGELRTDHRSVSGVAVVRRRTYEDDFWERWALEHPEDEPTSIDEADEAAVRMVGVAAANPIPTGEYYYLEVLETLSVKKGLAVPVPRSLVCGPRDCLWAVNATDEYEVVHHGADWQNIPTL